MATVKSFAVGNGDMYYINHNGDNFTVIDCNLRDDAEENRMMNEISLLRAKKGIFRFISTHPDEDHVRGIARFEKKVAIDNFYCVKNAATKKDESESFKRYVQLRDSDAAFYLTKGCSRKWMNLSGDGRDSSGIQIRWPDPENEYFKEALKTAAAGGSPNNISVALTYAINEGPTFMWMGDLESDFMEKVEQSMSLPKITVLFAPHHGRDSGKVPEAILSKLNPKIIVVGEAASEHLNYYTGYNTITQNRAGDIVFECHNDEMDVFTSNDCGVRDYLENKGKTLKDHFYNGTLVY